MVFVEQPGRERELNWWIVIDGRTVGSWKRTLARRGVTVEATLFTRLGRDETSALNAAVERFGSFLELPATLKTVYAA